MNGPSSILGAAAAWLLLASLILSNSSQLHDPFGVLALFTAGLFVSLGFVLFGRMRFDEFSGEDSGEDRPGI